jgi:hypothetical protein
METTQRTGWSVTRQRRLPLVGAALAAVLITALVAGCGDDYDRGTAAAAGDFCTNVEAFNASLMTTDIGPESTAEEIGATSEQLTRCGQASRRARPPICATRWLRCRGP